MDTNQPDGQMDPDYWIWPKNSGPDQFTPATSWGTPDQNVAALLGMLGMLGQFTLGIPEPAVGWAAGKMGMPYSSMNPFSKGMNVLSQLGGQMFAPPANFAVPSSFVEKDPMVDLVQPLDPIAGLFSSGGLNAVGFDQGQQGFGQGAIGSFGGYEGFGNVGGFNASGGGNPSAFDGFGLGAFGGSSGYSSGGGGTSTPDGFSW